MSANIQQAPFPEYLQLAIDTLELPLLPYWTVELDDIDRGQGSKGLTLTITVRGQDAYHPDQPRGTAHLFIVPAASYNFASWVRWLFDRCMDVAAHEMMEGFVVGAYRPFAPLHGPGEDPYFLHDLATDEARRTSFRGDVKPS